MLGKGALFAFMAAAAIAQESAPTSAPTSRAATEFTLPNGLRVRIAPVDVPGEVAVILGVRGAGILSEPAGMPHLAHVSEHVIFHGCEPADRDLVMEWFRSGRANAETLPDFMYFDLYPDPGQLATALRVQWSRLLSPRFDPGVLDRERRVAFSEVTNLEGNRNLRTDFLGKFAWCPFVQVAAHGAKDIAFRERTDAISTKDVETFHSRTFAPDHVMLTIVGDVPEPTRAHELYSPGATSGESASRQKTEPVDARRLPESRPALKAGTFAGSWDVASHQFFMAWPVPPPSDPSHPAISVLTQILNARVMMTSDVVKLTRRPIGVNADLGGLFVIQAPLKDEDGGAALAGHLQALLDALSADDSGFRMLKTFKSSVRALAGISTGKISYPPGLSRKVMAHANQELWRMRNTLAWGQKPEEYCARVDAVTAEDIRAAIKKHLTREKATIVTIAGKE